MKKPKPKKQKPCPECKGTKVIRRYGQAFVCGACATDPLSKKIRKALES